jgi:metal-responsive CopG/Arc/MetJ family transcriptional regulator
MMGKSKIAITLDQQALGRLDQLVRERAFPNRSQAIEEAIREKLDRLDRRRLARETGKLDPAFERALAEEGLSGDPSEWPEY